MRRLWRWLADWCVPARALTMLPQRDPSGIVWYSPRFGISRSALDLWGKR